MWYAGIAMAFLVGLVIGELSGAAGLVVAPLLILSLVGLVYLRRGHVSVDPDDDRRGWKAVELELSRARRMERSFSLARVDVGQSAAAQARDELLHVLRNRTRVVDASWYAGPQLLILLSETPSAQAGAVVRRFEGYLPVESSWSIAEYPRDGLTLEALLSSLEDRARSKATVEVSDGAL
jgi:hypothetical protein